MTPWHIGYRDIRATEAHYGALFITSSVTPH